MQDVTGTYKEVGTTHNFTWNPGFGLGSIVIKDSSGAVIDNQGAASYGVNSATFKFPGGTPFNIHDGADGLTVPVVHNSYTIVYGDQPGGWTYTYDFQDGKMPKDSAGADVPANQLTAVDAPHGAGSINKNVFGTYPVYIGTMSGPPGGKVPSFEPINNRVQNTTTTNSNAHGGLTGENGSLFISQVVGEDGVRHRVAVPAVFGTASFGIVNPSGNGSSYNSYGDFVKLNQQRTDLHPSGIAYDVYENQAASESGGDPVVNNAIRQKFKVSF